jgi:hypothetical protein
MTQAVAWLHQAGMMTTKRLRDRAAIALLSLTIVATACSSGGSSSSSTEPPTIASTTTTTSVEAVCEARDDLTNSIKALTDVDVVKNGTSSITEAIEAITTNLGKVKDAASAELKPKVDEFQSALRDLQDAVTNAGSSGVSGIVSAASDAASSGAAVVTSLQNLGCSESGGS